MTPARLALPAVNLRRFAWLAAALRPTEVGALESPFFRPDAVGAWGDKTSARWARALARARNLPCWTLEDGFYRSVGLGKAGAPALSFTLDPTGPYFDSRVENGLERALAGPIDAATAARGAGLRAFVVEKRLSKYNHLPEDPVRLEAPRGRPRILLVDQVAGDRSLAGAGATPETFRAMRAQAEALAQEGAANVFLKRHPDVVAGYGQGLLGAPSDKARPAPEAGPHALLDEIDEVWTASSQFGFDALLRGRRVVVFAAPFYAGWGLTQDRAQAAAAHAQAALARRAGRGLSLDALAGVAIGLYPRYFDPVRDAPTQAEAALERLAFWRDRRFARRGPVVAVGFARHKRALLRAHLGAAGDKTLFLRTEPSDLLDRARTAGAREIVAWSERLSRPAEAAARAQGLAVTRVEDGFVRSRGLGRTTTPALSLSLDARASYFDAGRSSDLETLLETHAFTDAERARGAALARAVVAAGVSKYNLREQGAPDLRQAAGGKRVSLVTAQVPGDASWRHGAVPFDDNLAFLAAVRQARPDDFLVFKDHPDLVAGLRSGATDPAAASRHADLVLTVADAAALYPQIDALHVMTSLAGFEALLRGREVECWGLPFYAGWGLTRDHVACPRRTRRLTRDELAVAALALYPAYLAPARGAQIPCQAEDMLALLGARA